MKKNLLTIGLAAALCAASAMPALAQTDSSCVVGVAGVAGLQRMTSAAARRR